MEGGESRKRASEQGGADVLPALLVKGAQSAEELWRLFEGYRVSSITVQPATVRLSGL
jgi:hypothetical protein